MDATAWIQLGVLCVGLASAAWAVVSSVGKKVDERFDKIDFQFQKVDLKFDNMSQAFNDRFDRMRDQGNDRHIANIERLARLEGQISALPQKIDPGQK